MYGVAFDTPGVGYFLRILSVIGAVVSILVLVGILAAFTAKYTTWKKFKKSSGYENEPFGINTWITYIGFIPDFALPLVFAIG